MARTTLTPVAKADGGAAVVFAAANAAGHMVPGGGDTIVLVTNGGGSPITVTVQTPATMDGKAVAEETGSVAAGATKRFGPFDPDTYDRPTGAADAGQVYIDFSAVTSVTCVALET